MSPAFGKGTARQRRLGGLLRRLRKAAGLSGPALAGRLKVSQSHVSRVELGETVATAKLVERWTCETGASQADRDTAADLTEAVEAEFVSWREALASGLVKLQCEALAAEAASATRIAYVPGLIPGLMQTPEYATHLRSAFDGLTRAPSQWCWCVARGGVARRAGWCMWSRYPTAPGRRDCWLRCTGPRCWVTTSRW